LDHLKVCPLYKAANREKQPAEIAREELFAQKVTMTQDALTDHVLQTIIAGDLPFSHADNAASVRLLKITFPKLSLPTAIAVAKRLTDKVRHARNYLKELFGKFDGKVSIASDTWNSQNNTDFLGMFSSNLYRAI
jgi:hypothetical protein